MEDYTKRLWVRERRCHRRSGSCAGLPGATRPPGPPQCDFIDTKLPLAIAGARALASRLT
jgi:hypothetical protein